MTRLFQIIRKIVVPILLLVVLMVGAVATTLAQGGDKTRGAQLFAQNCAVCHGDRAQGRVGATLAKDFPGIRVDSLLNEIISNGVGGSVMPAWSKSKGGPLSDQAVDDLVAFIRSLGNQAPTPVPVALAPTAKPPVALPVATFPPGDASRGTKIYTDNCVVCHGDQGQGRIGASLQKDWPGINVNALLDATVARGVAGSKMPAWSKTSGGPLTDQEIADVVAFVRTLKKPGLAPTSPAVEAQQSGMVFTVLGLVCFGLVVVAGLVVLGIGLSGSRQKTS